MPQQIEPMKGSGRFQWNGGAWFGTMMGSTAWMLGASGFLLINRQAMLALVPSFAFSLSMMFAAVLWGRRDSVSPYKATMIMMGLFAVLVPTVFFTILFAANDEVLEKMNWNATPFNIAFIFGLCPTLMAYFWFLERRALADNA